MKHMEEDQGARLVRCVLGVLLGGGVALLACFLFLLLASAGISKGWIGEQLMYQMTVVGCVIGGFSGGTAAIRRCQSRALIVGLLTGCVFFLILLTIGGIIPAVWGSVRRRGGRSAEQTAAGQEKAEGTPLKMD